MISGKLQVLVVEPDFNKRHSLINFIESSRRVNVSVVNDYESIIDNTSLRGIDLIFINFVPGKGLRAPEIIRFMTRMRMVSKWCKFAIVSSDISFQLASPIHRPIKTEQIILPTNQQQIDRIIIETLEIQEVLRPFIDELYQLPIKELHKQIQQISENNNHLLNLDDVTKIKINLLLRANHWSQAFSLTEKIRDIHEKNREKLHILALTGNREKLTTLINHLMKEGIFQRGCIYYLVYQALLERNFNSAICYLSELDLFDLTPSEVELYALLQIAVGKTTLALDFLDNQLFEAKKKTHHFFRIKLAKLRCLCWLTITHESKAMREFALSEIDKSLSDDIWQINKLTKQTKLFVRLGLLLLKQRDEAYTLFKVLMHKYTSLNAYQLNLMLYVANTLNLKEASYALHMHLEKRRASLEMSPEFLTFQLMHREVLVRSMDSESIRNRLFRIANRHVADGRLYRALSRLYEICELDLANDETNFEFKSIKKRLNIDNYWGG